MSYQPQQGQYQAPVQPMPQAQYQAPVQQFPGQAPQGQSVGSGQQYGAPQGQNTQRKSNFVTVIKDNVSKSINDYIKWQKEKIGRDINPDELIKRLKDSGVKRVVMRKPVFRKLEFNEIAINISSLIVYQGVEEQ